MGHHGERSKSKCDVIDRRPFNKQNLQIYIDKNNCNNDNNSYYIYRSTFRSIMKRSLKIFDFIPLHGFYIKVLSITH
jgi:hypothetical protein